MLCRIPALVRVCGGFAFFAVVMVWIAIMAFMFPNGGTVALVITLTSIGLVGTCHHVSCRWWHGAVGFDTTIVVCRQGVSMPLCKARCLASRAHSRRFAHKP
jgi:hypothetical protein